MKYLLKSQKMTKKPSFKTKTSNIEIYWALRKYFYFFISKSINLSKNSPKEIFKLLAALGIRL